jgi:hypothetical protein
VKKFSKSTYTLKGKLWIYPGDVGNWYFLTIPKNESTQITETFKTVKRGWGSLPVEAAIKKSSWNTSIFPDSKSGTYILPIKALIRKKEDLSAGMLVTCTITLYP